MATRAEVSTNTYQAERAGLPVPTMPSQPGRPETQERVGQHRDGSASSSALFSPARSDLIPNHRDVGSVISTGTPQRPARDITHVLEQAGEIKIILNNATESDGSSGTGPGQEQTHKSADDQDESTTALPAEHNGAGTPLPPVESSTETAGDEPLNFFPPGHDERIAAIEGGRNAKIEELRGQNATAEEINEAMRPFTEQLGETNRDAHAYLRTLAEPYKTPPSDENEWTTVTEETEEGPKTVVVPFTRDEVDAINGVRDILEGPDGMIRQGMRGPYPQRDIWLASTLFPRERVSAQQPSLSDRERAVDGIFELAREAQRALKHYGDTELAEPLREIEALPQRLHRHGTELPGEPNIPSEGNPGENPGETDNLLLESNTLYKILAAIHTAEAGVDNSQVALAGHLGEFAQNYPDVSITDLLGQNPAFRYRMFKALLQATEETGRITQKDLIAQLGPDVNRTRAGNNLASLADNDIITYTQIQRNAPAAQYSIDPVMIGELPPYYRGQRTATIQVLDAARELERLGREITNDTIASYLSEHGGSASAIRMVGPITAHLANPDNGFLVREGPQFSNVKRSEIFLTPDQRAMLTEFVDIFDKIESNAQGYAEAGVQNARAIAQDAEAMAALQAKAQRDSRRTEEQPIEVTKQQLSEILQDLPVEEATTSRIRKEMRARFGKTYGIGRIERNLELLSDLVVSAEGGLNHYRLGETIQEEAEGVERIELSPPDYRDLINAVEQARTERLSGEQDATLKAEINNFFDQQVLRVMIREIPNVQEHIKNELLGQFSDEPPSDLWVQTTEEISRRERQIAARFTADEFAEIVAGREALRVLGAERNKTATTLAVVESANHFPRAKLSVGNISRSLENRRGAVAGILLTAQTAQIALELMEQRGELDQEDEKTINLSILAQLPSKLNRATPESATEITTPAGSTREPAQASAEVPAEQVVVFEAAASGAAPEQAADAKREETAADANRLSVEERRTSDPRYNTFSEIPSWRSEERPGATYEVTLTDDQIMRNPQGEELSLKEGSLFIVNELINSPEPLTAEQIAEQGFITDANDPPRRVRETMRELRRRFSRFSEDFPILQRLETDGRIVFMINPAVRVVDKREEFAARRLAEGRAAAARRERPAREPAGRQETLPERRARQLAQTSSAFSAVMEARRELEDAHPTLGHSLNLSVAEATGLPIAEVRDLLAIDLAADKLDINLRPRQIPGVSDMSSYTAAVFDRLDRAVRSAELTPQERLIFGMHLGLPPTMSSYNTFRLIRRPRGTETEPTIRPYQNYYQWTQSTRENLDYDVPAVRVRKVDPALLV